MRIESPDASRPAVAVPPALIDPRTMALGDKRPMWRGSHTGRRVGIVAAAIVLAGLLAFALSRLDLSRVGHALITATPGWVALAFGLMSFSLVLRAVSWQQKLRAELTETPVGLAQVARATMIGVMASALFPARIGEPSRVLVLTRRLNGPTRALLPVVAGTVFSQTFIHLLGL